MRIVAAAAAAALLACAAPRESAPSFAGSAPARSPSRCAAGFGADCRDLGRAALGADERLAAALLTKACELGDPAGCSDLAVLHAIGLGLAQSDARAAALSRRACEQGAAIACSNQGALLAEGVAAAEPGEAVASRVLRLFRAACDAGVPEGCANLAAALAGGRLAPRDLGAAAHAHRRACDAGLALACHRLALLAGEQPALAPGLSAAELEARSCAAAIVPACAARGERTPPASVRTPAARLVEDPESFLLGIPGAGGFSPAELAPVRATGAARPSDETRRPREALVAQVPEALRARLGLGGPARAAGEEDAAVELLLALRRHELGQCHEAPRAAAAPAAEAFAVFRLAGDGRPVDVATATSPADPALDACVAERVRAWEFPSSPEGSSGPYLVRAAFEPAPAGGAPGYSGPGSLRPALREPGCVERRLSVPGEYRGAAGEVAVKLAVDTAGTPSQLHMLAPVPEAILGAVAAAVRACPWSPGADGEGRPATLWVTLRVSLAGR